MTARLELVGITKRFPKVIANDNVHLRVEPGEVHGLLGENGAGKSTLMEVAYGLYRADAGRILIDGLEHQFRSPQDARLCGLAMVHQHCKLVPNLTVAENVLLESRSGRWRVDLAPVTLALKEVADRYELQIDPTALVSDLGVGALQRVELLKALYRDAQLLILDEPSSLLTPRETEHLFQIMRDLVAGDRSVIFITHKLSEVLSVTDRVTVLRRGRLQGVVATVDANERLLTSLMVGSDAVPSPASRTVSSITGQALLRLKNVSVVERSRYALRAIELEIMPGEILGIAGVEGNGQRELAEVAVGLRRTDTGSVEVCGEDMTGRRHDEIVDLGVGFIPEDRQHLGLVMDLSVSENLLLRRQHRHGMSKRGIIDRRRTMESATAVIEAFQIATPGSESLVALLSGGNQQKVVLARELRGEPRLIVAAQPTRGLDIAASAYVHALLIERRNRGSGVLLISTNLDEVCSLSDRVAVLYRGEIVATIPSTELDRQRIGLLMGVGRSAEARLA